MDAGHIEGCLPEDRISLLISNKDMVYGQSALGIMYISLLCPYTGWNQCKSLIADKSADDDLFVPKPASKPAAKKPAAPKPAAARKPKKGEPRGDRYTGFPPCCSVVLVHTSAESPSFTLLAFSLSLTHNCGLRWLNRAYTMGVEWDAAKSEVPQFCHRRALLRWL